MQDKILRVLQQKVVVPMGGTVAHAVDIRLIATADSDLHPMIHAGTFRSDLYSLMNMPALHAPTLSERAEDILPLANHFLQVQARVFGERVKNISPAVAHVLQSYRWPGNVRELNELMQQAHMLASSGTIELNQMPRHLRAMLAPVDNRNRQTASLGYGVLQISGLATAQRAGLPSPSGRRCTGDQILHSL